MATPMTAIRNKTNLVIISELCLQHLLGTVSWFHYLT